MFLFRKPSPNAIHSFLEANEKLPFNYTEVGSSAEVPPGGYSVGRSRVHLGKGEPTFAAAREALRRWEQFRVGWLELYFHETPLEPGRQVAIVARVLGLWTVNVCRIVYVIDEPTRFGFAYGTLPGHVARGEERFLVEFDRQADSVWFDILAFSRPNHVLTWLGYPFFRWTQRQFRRESAAALARAVSR